MPRNRSTILNVKVIHYPTNCKPLSKSGRLYLINIELNLFQELVSTVHWSDGYIMLPWFVAVHFHILTIPNKEAPGSRQLSINARVIWLCACLSTPGWYGFAHALGTGQVLGWCTCVNCLSPPQRPLCVVGRLWRKKKRARGARWEGERENNNNSNNKFIFALNITKWYNTNIERINK